MTRPDVCSEVPDGRDRIVARERAEALHDEIQRLPVVFRLPVVLCYIEGLTVEEAARQLRWPRGTVSAAARCAIDFAAASMRRGVVCPPPPPLCCYPKPTRAAISSSLCETRPSSAIRFAAARAGAGSASASLWPLPIRS